MKRSRIERNVYQERVEECAHETEQIRQSCVIDCTLNLNYRNAANKKFLDTLRDEAWIGGIETVLQGLIFARAWGPLESIILLVMHAVMFPDAQRNLYAACGPRTALAHALHMMCDPKKTPQACYYNTVLRAVTREKPLIRLKTVEDALWRGDSTHTKLIRKFMFTFSKSVPVSNGPRMFAQLHTFPVIPRVPQLVVVERDRWFCDKQQQLKRVCSAWVCVINHILHHGLHHGGPHQREALTTCVALRRTCTLMAYTVAACFRARNARYRGMYRRLFAREAEVFALPATRRMTDVHGVANAAAHLFPARPAPRELWRQSAKAIRIL